MVWAWGIIGLHIGYWWESQNENPVGRPTRMWMDNIKIRERGWDVKDWIGVV
jgi:hypothetical protein